MENYFVMTLLVIIMSVIKIVIVEQGMNLSLRGLLKQVEI
jgi:hypothetical protein